MSSWIDFSDTVEPSASTNPNQPSINELVNNTTDHNTNNYNNGIHTDKHTQNVQTSSGAHPSSTTTHASILALNEIELEVNSIQQQYDTQLMNEITYNLDTLDSNKNINPFIPMPSTNNTNYIQFHQNIVQSYQKRITTQNNKLQHKIGDLTGLGISQKKSFQLNKQIQSAKNKKSLRHQRAVDQTDKQSHKILQNINKNKQRKKSKY